MFKVWEREVKGTGGRRPQRAVGVSRKPSPRTYVPFLFLSPVIRDPLVVSSCSRAVSLTAPFSDQGYWGTPRAFSLVGCKSGQRN